MPTCVQASKGRWGGGGHASQEHEHGQQTSVSPTMTTAPGGTDNSLEVPQLRESLATPTRLPQIPAAPSVPGQVCYPLTLWGMEGDPSHQRENQDILRDGGQTAGLATGTEDPSSAAATASSEQAFGWTSHRGTLKLWSRGRRGCGLLNLRNRGHGVTPGSRCHAPSMHPPTAAAAPLLLPQSQKTQLFAAPPEATPLEALD